MLLTTVTMPTEKIKRSANLMVRQIISVIATFITASAGVSLYPHEAGAQELSTRASDTTPVHDDRVGQVIYSNSADLPDGVTIPDIPICSASHIGNNHWITAAHCVNAMSPFSGFIQQDDGDRTDVTEVWIAPGGEDIALLQVDSQIANESFSVASSPAVNGSRLTLLGYGGEHSYMSAAEIEIEKFLKQKTIGEKRYPNVYQTTSMEESRSCSGDSGGPIFSGTELYAVHSAGEKNPNCEGKNSSTMWHSDVTLLKSTIEQKVYSKAANPDVEAKSSQPESVLSS